MPASTPTLTELAMAAAWYQDGLSGSEHQALRTLQGIDTSNPQFFEKMSTWAWVFDSDMLGDEERVIWHIADLGARVSLMPSSRPTLLHCHGLPTVSKLGKECGFFFEYCG